jgi:tRNA(Arg) A34 adenosine deaminase TadA
VSDLFPGVSAVSGRLSGPEEAAARAAELARQAAASGTFGIGGILTDRSGRVLAEAVNAVIEHGLVRDPTAHVERQLVDWYFEARHQGLTTAPGELVIVSSLDPCAMCAGAILRSGLNCIAVAPDPTSGVHKEGKPTRMPEQLRARAEARMAFFGVAGRHPRLGANLGAFFNGDIAHDTVRAATSSFAKSLDQVRQMVGSGEGPSDVSGLADDALPSLQAALPEGIWVCLRWNSAKQRLDQGHQLLSDFPDASIIVDRRGRFIAGAKSAEDRSAARSSVLELIRAYVVLRRLAGERLNAELPHQRYCTIVKRRPPDEPDKALMELGAVGSFLEQPRPSSPLPALAFTEWSSKSSKMIARYVASLPPFYTEVIGIGVGPVKAMLS